MIGLILESILLIINAIAILNEKRFLKKCRYEYNNRWIRYIVGSTQQSERCNYIEISNNNDDIFGAFNRQVCVDSIKYCGHTPRSCQLILHHFQFVTRFTLILNLQQLNPTQSQFLRLFADNSSYSESTLVYKVALINQFIFLIKEFIFMTFISAFSILIFLFSHQSIPHLREFEEDGKQHRIDQRQILIVLIKTQILKFKLKQILMEASLTESKAPQIPILVRALSEFNKQEKQPCLNRSSSLLDKIYQTLNSPSNYRDDRSHKQSLSIEQTHQPSTTKCKCKKSKCLKLYCECFSNGSFCRDCNCQCCQNTEQFSQIRAKAIDEVMIRAAIPFGHKNSTIKGCNCKKTDCTKKYCECYGSGQKCSQYCKCSNCLNC